MLANGEGAAKPRMALVVECGSVGVSGVAELAEGFAGTRGKCTERGFLRSMT